MDPMSSFNQALFSPWGIIWGIIKFFWKLISLVFIGIGLLGIFIYKRARRLIYHIRNKSNTSSSQEQTLV